MSAHTSQTELKLIGKLILEGDDALARPACTSAPAKARSRSAAPIIPWSRTRSAGPTCRAVRCAARSARCWSSRPALAVPAELVYLSRRKGQEVRIHQSDRPDDDICLLFGRNPGRMERVQGETLETSQATPARLAVFDAPLDPESITPQMRENLDDELTEVKSENAIDRITSQANPRTLERVPAGARFSTRLVMDVLCEEDAPLFLRVLEGLRLLEDDALGGGGSRGSGRVSFANLRWCGAARTITHPAPRKRRSAPGPALAAIQTGRVRFRLRDSCARRNEPGTGRETPSHRTLAHRARIRARATAWTPIYHSDSLYCGGHVRPWRVWGCCEEWLDATAARGRSGGLLQLLFPVSRGQFVIVPPRSVWPPRRRRCFPRGVRWKSARFVPLEMVHALLAGRKLDESAVERGWRQRMPDAGGQAGAVPRLACAGARRWIG